MLSEKISVSSAAVFIFFIFFIINKRWITIFSFSKKQKVTIFSSKNEKSGIAEILKSREEYFECLVQ